MNRYLTLRRVEGPEHGTQTLGTSLGTDQQVPLIRMGAGVHVKADGACRALLDWRVKVVNRCGLVPSGSEDLASYTESTGAVSTRRPSPDMERRSKP